MRRERSFTEVLQPHDGVASVDRRQDVEVPFAIEVGCLQTGAPTVSVDEHVLREGPLAVVLEPEQGIRATGLPTAALVQATPPASGRGRQVIDSGGPLRLDEPASVVGHDPWLRLPWTIQALTP